MIQTCPVRNREAMELESEETEEAMDQDSEEKRDTFPTFRFKN